MLHENKTIVAAPAKRFFVDMFTRDIDLQDAILDLLDNCIDGVVRTIRNANQASEASTHSGRSTYEGFYAEISINKDSFLIRDNCGGIPQNIGEEQAFRMGRPSNKRNEDIATIGMYGIGMKRSIFKMGRNCTVKSYTSEGAYQVRFTPEWMANDESWDLVMEPINNQEPPGTVIYIDMLLEHISRMFDSQGSIHHELPQRIAQNFCYIIQKGFTIIFNGHPIVPSDMGLLIPEDGRLNANSITPYIYHALKNGVDIKLAVGFYRAMLDNDELEEEAVTKRSSEDAGWTIVCNDRVVLYNDKSLMTGWGELGVPAYHTQFIGIRGVVFFSSNQPENLPLTTTKRGVDGSSLLYLQVKNIMREGLKKFTDYTNHWKTNPIEEKKVSNKTKPISVFNLFELMENSEDVKNRPNTEDRFLNLSLARHQTDDPLKQIKFSRRLSEIQKVSQYFFPDEETMKPGIVGEACFNHILKSNI